MSCDMLSYALLSFPCHGCVKHNMDDVPPYLISSIDWDSSSSDSDPDPKDKKLKIEDMWCQICVGPGHEDQLLLCDDCDRGFHTFCLAPPLPGIKEGVMCMVDHGLAYHVTCHMSLVT